MLTILLVDHQLRAADADTGENVQDEREELDVVHRASEAEVAEVTRTLVVCLTAATALLP